jgi:ubiquinone/menaquinone biosynthesis C-methylase UbiE
MVIQTKTKPFRHRVLRESKGTTMMKNVKTVQRETYDTFGEEYHEIQVAAKNIRRALDPFTIDVWKRVVRGKRVLDVGCGSGRVTNALAPYCESIVGLDISEGLVKIAKRESQSKRAVFVVGDAEHLPFKEETFDVVVCYGLLHHMEYPERVINEASRVLREGGVFLGFELMETELYDEIDFWSVYFPIPRFVKNIRASAKNVVGAFKVKPENYIAKHPGHPGKRTIQQYQEYMESAGLDLSYDDLLFPFLPMVFASTFNSTLMRFFVKVSKKMSAWKRVNGKGLEIVFIAKKTLKKSVS